VPAEARPGRWLLAHEGVFEPWSLETHRAVATPTRRAAPHAWWLTRWSARTLESSRTLAPCSPGRSRPPPPTPHPFRPASASAQGGRVEFALGAAAARLPVVAAAPRGGWLLPGAHRVVGLPLPARVGLRVPGERLQVHRQPLGNLCDGRLLLLPGGARPGPWPREGASLPCLAPLLARCRHANSAALPSSAPPAHHRLDRR
jgi:hypothetical protein